MVTQCRELGRTEKCPLDPAQKRMIFLTEIEKSLQKFVLPPD
jgi:hypothetical protein